MVLKLLTASGQDIARGRPFTFLSVSGGNGSPNATSRPRAACPHAQPALGPSTCRPEGQVLCPGPILPASHEDTQGPGKWSPRALACPGSRAAGPLGSCRGPGAHGSTQPTSLSPGSRSQDRRTGWPQGPCGSTLSFRQGSNGHTSSPGKQRQRGR